VLHRCRTPRLGSGGADLPRGCLVNPAALSISLCDTSLLVQFLAYESPGLLLWQDLTTIPPGRHRSRAHFSLHDAPPARPVPRLIDADLSTSWMLTLTSQLIAANIASA
jgi:hypothetical protein